MNHKTFYYLLFFTIIFSIVAAAVVIKEPTIQSSDFNGDLIFPELAQKLEKLEKIVIKQKDTSFTLNYSSNGWSMLERGGYPVNSAKVSELLIGLTTAIIIEPKTELSHKYGRLDLADPSGDENSRAKRVTFSDSSGSVFTDFFVGKRKFTLGAEKGGTYLRLLGLPQTWLVSGEINPGSRPRDWLQREILDIPSKDIRKVKVTHADGSSFIVLKADKDTQDYSMANMPAGMKLKRADILNDIGSIFSGFLFDDVKPFDQFKFSEGKVFISEFYAFSGLAITLELYELEDENWLRLKAIPSSEKKTARNKASEGLNELELLDLVSDINSKTGLWVYKLPAYEVAPLKKVKEDLLDPIENVES